MEKWKLRILTTVLFLAALAVSLLPLGRFWESRLRRQQTLASLQRYLSAVEGTDVQRERKLAQWYNLAVRENRLDAQTQSAYGKLLCMPNAEMGFLYFAGSSQTFPVVHEGDDTQKTSVLIHTAESSLPVGGKGNHVILRGSVLTDPAGEGELFYLYVLDEILAYKVVSTGTQLPKTKLSEDLCTLQIDIQDRKVYISGIRVEAPDPLPEALSAAQMDTGSLLAAGGASAAMGVLLLIPILANGIGIRRKVEKKQTIRK